MSEPIGMNQSSRPSGKQYVRPADANQLVEHFFRHEYANLVSVLTRAFGFGMLELIEDMVQGAMLSAMNSWRSGKIPDNPAAWLHRVARNRILDALRRQKAHRHALANAAVAGRTTDSLMEEWFDTGELGDSLLRMMFACCHPALDRESEIALTLKLLCGLSTNEIARGLLKSPVAVRKRIQRARKSLADNQVSVEFPAAEEQARRLAADHDVLYLMFNEGYSASSGSLPILEDVCEEAARLCHMLATHDSLGTPSTKALLALMLFHAARSDSRIDDQDAVVLLSDQDRSLWDQGLIGMAEVWLSRSKTEQPCRFHFEAAIAQQHCRASTFQQTDWHRIIQLYDRLLGLNESPVYRLNRAIAIAQAGRLTEAFEELNRARWASQLKDYCLIDCTSAMLHQSAGNMPAAIKDYQNALTRQPADHERRLIEKKLKTLQANGWD